MIIYKASIMYAMSPSDKLNWKCAYDYGNYEMVYEEDLSLNLDSYDINDVVNKLSEDDNIEKHMLSCIFGSDYFDYSDDYADLGIERVKEDIKSNNIFVRLNIEVWDEYKYIKGLNYYKDFDKPMYETFKLHSKLYKDLFNQELAAHDKYITSHKYTYDYNNKNIIDKTYYAGSVIEGGYGFNGLDTVSQEFFDNLKVGSLVSVRLYDYDMNIHKGIVLLKDCEDINVRTELYMLKIFMIDLEEEYKYFVTEPSWIVSVDGYDEDQANSLIEKYKDINLLNN